MYGQQQLAYAPTPYSYTPTSNLSATINQDEEVSLDSTPAERDLYESLAEIYSIIVTLDGLERAYLKDSIPETEYTDTCNRLLKQYKSNLASDDSVARAFGDLETFKMQWMLEAPRAIDRLKIGLPATVEGGTGRSNNNNNNNNNNNTTALNGNSADNFRSSGAVATDIVAVSECFITLLDAIKMQILSKDTLHPLLVETIQAANKVTDRDFESKGKIVQWLITLNQMRAADEIDQEQARDLHFDMTAAYEGFKAVL